LKVKLCGMVISLTRLLKFQAFRLKRPLIGNWRKKRTASMAKKASWMMPITHGYHVVEDQSFKGGADESDSDSVVVQREQIAELELWYFGISDAQIGHGVSNYMQSHLFYRNPSEVIKMTSNACSFSCFLSCAQIS